MKRPTRSLLGTLACLSFVLAACFAPASALADVVDGKLWVPNDLVYALANTGDTLYVGGRFTYVGPVTGGFASFSDADGSRDVTFPVADGAVQAIVPDGAGGWFVGGAFTKIGGVSRAGLARLNPDFGVAAWNPGCDGSVQSLCVAGAKLYVGGTFTSIGGMTRKNLAAFDAATGDSSALVLSANAAVYDLLYDDGKLYAAGDFTTIGSAPRNFVAALDTATGLATAWNASASGTVRALALDGGTLFLGGNFTSIGGSARSFCAAFDAATGALKPFAPSLSGAVYVVLPGATSVRVGGQFTSSGGQPRGYAAAFDRTTGSLLPWNPRADNLVQSMIATSDGILLGGTFRAVGDSVRNSLARVDSVTGAPLAWNAATSGGVTRLRLSGARVLACGTFASAGGVRRDRAAAFDLRTGLPTAWNPGANGAVRALLVDGSSVYLGGLFTELAGESHGYLAAVDRVTGQPAAWDPALDGAVLALARDGTNLYAGGQFTAVGATPRLRLASFSRSTHALGTLAPSVDNTVWALTISNGRLYLGGDFLTCNVTRTRAAAIDLVTNQTTSWNPVFNASVYALTSDARTVYAGGAFTTMNGAAKPYLASINPFTGTTTNALFTRQPNAKVTALALSEALLLAGGDFTTVGGTARAKFAGVDTLTGQLTSWAPTGNGSVLALDVAFDTFIAGGAFTQVLGETAPYLVKIDGATFEGLSASDVTVAEGSSGAWTLQVPVTIGSRVGSPVSVHWTLADSTALAADGDYTPASGTATIPAGQVVTYLPIEVRGDNKLELTERLLVLFDNPVGAHLNMSRIRVTLTNDDTIPSLSVLDAARLEGDSGTTPMPFVVRLSNPTYLPVSVQYSTTDGTAIASSGDYLSVTGTANFAPGETSDTLTVFAVGDTALELHETFFLDLAAPVHATLADAHGVGTILSDDMGPVLRSVTDVPGDQGGWVWLGLDRCLIDSPAETATPVLTYNVWRRISTGPLAKSADALAAAGPIPVLGPEALAALSSWPIELRDGRVVVESNVAQSGPVAAFPPGTWAIVGSFAATQEPRYQVLAPTVTDSPLVSHFVVSAHTTQPSIWTVGRPDSGSSLDNIAPGVPTAFAAQVANGAVALSWGASEARDFQYFRLHRGASEVFTPDETNLVHETASLGWSDGALTAGTRWYKLVALDHAGNPSAPATASVTLTLGAESELPRAYALSTPSPNPFADRVALELAVPRAGAARVAVYDVAGRVVRVLLAGRVAPGRLALEWDGRDAEGARVAPGLYLCRASAPGFEAVRRMVVLP